MKLLTEPGMKRIGENKWHFTRISQVIICNIKPGHQVVPCRRILRQGTKNSPPLVAILRKG